MERYKRVCAYIDLDDICHNFDQMYKRLPKGTKIMAVVKADGYGHGAVPVSKEVEHLEYIWGFGVATLEEGRSLREHGIEKPIHILGYTFPEDYKEVLRNDLQPTIFTLEMAEDLNAVAKELGVQGEIHIGVDTGMSRIGLKDNEEGIELIETISHLPYLSIVGCFTHFVKADEEDKEKSYDQIRRFQSIKKNLEERKIKIPLYHCSNSAGIIEFQDLEQDLVRSGISNYGIYPSNEVNRSEVCLRPALSLKSHIIFVKEIEQGTSISYGATFVAPEKMKVATIPVGYGDGYPRSLSNKGWVLIHGKKAPILGRVCMDQLMVDVTQIENVSTGDEVTLIGRSGEEELTVEELGDLSGRFSYEFICDLGNRIPRCYVKNGKVIYCKEYFVK